MSFVSRSFCFEQETFRNSLKRKKTVSYSDGVINNKYLKKHEKMISPNILLMGGEVGGKNGPSGKWQLAE